MRFAWNTCANGGNASDAYRAAYATKRMSAKTINEAAFRLLRNSKVTARIEELRERVAQRTVLDESRTLDEMARLAYADPAELYDNAGRFKPIKDLPPHVRAAIASVKTRRTITKKADEVISEEVIVDEVKLWNKNTAIDMANKHMGLYERDNAQRRQGPMDALEDLPEAILDLIEEKLDAIIGDSGVAEHVRSVDPEPSQRTTH